MPYLTGVVVALLTGLLCRLAGLDRDRAVYPVVLIVTASYYVLFAAMGGSTRAVIVESTLVTGFTIIAVTGFRWSLWWIVAALAGHGAFDLVHDRVVSNPGVPAWWPAFCLSFDVALAVFLALLLRRGDLRARSVKEAQAVGSPTIIRSENISPALPK